MLPFVKVMYAFVYTCNYLLTYFEVSTVSGCGHSARTDLSRRREAVVPSSADSRGNGYERPGRRRRRHNAAAAAVAQAYAADADDGDDDDVE